jgi:hypothetical protein
MRRRPFRAVRGLIVGCCLSLSAVRWANAQSNPDKVEGGAELLLPTGARSLGMGQTVAATAVGSEALWWNPALVARGPRELALHLTKNSSLIAETDAIGAFIFPVRRLGAFALSFRYINYGTQAAQLNESGQVGTLRNTATILAATFAPILTDRLSGGITYKLLRYQFDCTGTSCDNPTNQPQVPAIDAGFVYVMRSDSSFSLGGSVRNLGPKLQVKDQPQADNLPGRLDLGFQYAPRLAQLPPEARVRVGADVVSFTSGGGSLGLRFGGELAWQDRYQARAGYVVSSPTGSGATFGFGIRTGKLQIDLAQFLSDLGSQSGVTPTFVSLRYLF